MEREPIDGASVPCPISSQFSRSCRLGRALSLAGAGFIGSLALTSFGAAIVPATGAGASNPASLNCGTLEILGTDGNTYQFSEFTTGNATRGPNIDAGGAVAYGGNLAANNFTVAQNLSPLATTSLTALVGGNESGQFNIQKGSVVVAGTASGPINLNGGTGTTKTVGGGAGTIPFSFSSIGTALAGCSNNYGPNGTTTLGTVTQLNPGFSTLGFYGTGQTNVFDLTTDQLAGVQKIDFSVPAHSTTLVELTPSTDFSGSLNLAAISGNIYYGCPTTAPGAGNSLWNSGNCGSQPSANENTTTIDVERDNTVWNLPPNSFPASDTLTVEGWQGTIVAPDQSVTLDSDGQFDGSIFAASISGGEQTNDDPFGGTMPTCYDPLPAALGEGLPIAMGGLALLALAGVVLYRRRPSAVIDPSTGD
ncbi:MAG TPA: choice-of-anchor A family protein [Acidimicrobiales bacterium]|nr:choice-of-anchor A family protein [Acidimicrobiales bacterium]